MKEKHIRGYRTSSGARVMLGGEPLRHHCRHSPTGFEWGYGGSGPADLARSILIEVLNPETEEAWETVEGLYQQFKEDIVARLPETWVLHTNAIWAWVVCALGAERAIKLFNKEWTRRGIDRRKATGECIADWCPYASRIAEVISRLEGEK